MNIMFPNGKLKTLLTTVLLVHAILLNAQQKPLDYFSFEPGSDRNLFTYEELIDYLQSLDAASDRLKMVEIGKSPQGRSMYIAFLSSADNLARLDELKAFLETRLADLMAGRPVVPGLSLDGATNL